MPTRMTREEAKIEQAIRAARIAKQTLLEETRNSMPLVVEEEEVDVEDGIEEKPTIKVPNQDKEGYGLAGVEEEYKIKKSFTEEEKRKLGADLAALLEKDPEEALREMETKIIARMRQSVRRKSIRKAQTPTSYDEVIQRVDKELASGDSPIKEILSLVRNMAYTKKRNNEPFTIDTFKQMLAEAKKEVSWMRFMGIKF